MTEQKTLEAQTSHEDESSPNLQTELHANYWRNRGQGLRRWHGRNGPSEHWRHSEAWRKKRRYIFRRAVRFFALAGILILGGMAVASFLITRYFDGDTHTAALVWMTGCTLSLALPLMAIAVAMRGYRGFATPLANVMAAADAVAAGDLSTRVPEPPSGELGRLAKSFNHMATELERSDQQRRNLTADVAHELRTPLHIIQGNLEGIIDGVYDATPEHINATLDETRSLARLIDDLRTLSLAEAGELSLVSEMVDVSELLADIDTSFRGQAEAQGVGFECSVNHGSAPLLIEGDPGRLDQVLSNLLVNALRHTSAGDKICLLAKREDDANIVIEIIDSGEGISDADLPYIFDRFWRGDRARSHSDGTGGGLGLAITRQLVNAHGGSISAESRHGEGTTFRISLPFVG